MAYDYSRYGGGRKFIRPTGFSVGSFGDKFRQQREQRGISLDAIANTTKISTRMLRALEEERFDQLPGGIFNRGFVRAYARHVGLDEEQALTDYLTALRESQIQEQAILPEFRPSPEPVAVAKAPAPPKPPDRPKEKDRPQAPDQPKQNQPQEARPKEKDRSREEARPQALAPPPAPPRQELPPKELPLRELLPRERASRDRQPNQRFPERFAARPVEAGAHSQTRIPWGVLALALLLVALSLAFWSHRQRQRIDADITALARNATPTAESQTAPASGGNQTPPPRTSLEPAASQPHTPPPSVAPGSRTSASAAPSPSVASSPSVAAAAGASPNRTATTQTVPAQPPPSPAPAANPRPAARPAKPFTLLIRAEETSWVSITVDGQPVASETLIAPAAKAIRANQEIVVKTGNAGGLVFAVNDKTFPRQGDHGEVKTFLFDGHNMQVVLGDSAPANP